MILNDYGASAEEIKKYFYKCIERANDAADMKSVFNVAINSPGYSLFPYISANLRTYEEFINAWIDLFRAVRARTAYNVHAAHKAVADDMSVVKIVACARGISEQSALEKLTAHNDFMLAEGVQGYLLEEYVATRAREQNLIYVSGILRSVDFCSPDGKFLLQVKNKNNSEVSPSVKTGQKIIKWYRVIHRSTVIGSQYITNWQKLNKLISDYSGKACNYSEEEFLGYIQRVISVNKRIID